MSAVKPYAVDGTYDAVLYTHRTTRDEQPVTVSLGIRTGLTVFRNNQSMGVRSYPWAVAVAVLVALVRVALIAAVLPAILVTVWLAMALSPFVLFLGLALAEARFDSHITLFGRELQLRRENGVTLFFVETLLVGASAVAVLLVTQFEQLLQFTLGNILVITPVIIVAVLGRAVISYAASDAASDAPMAVDQSVTTDQLNRLVEAVNYQLPDGVSPIPTVPTETPTPQLEAAVREHGVAKAFEGRINATSHQGEAAMDLDDALRSVLGEDYTSPYETTASAHRQEE